MESIEERFKRGEDGSLIRFKMPVVPLLLSSYVEKKDAGKAIRDSFAGIADATWNTKTVLKDDAPKDNIKHTK
jgi:hypothetical protein